MRPYVHTKGSMSKIVWVTDCSVGKGAQNSLSADVSYLQWYYTLAANYDETSPQHKLIYRNVLVTGSCTGLDSDPLVQAILLQQKDFGHPVIDGKASVVHGSGFVDDKAFFVVRLGALFAVMQPRSWPRLDLIPSCPTLVAQASRQAIPQRSDFG
jgi:hypothetical protein